MGRRVLSFGLAVVAVLSSLACAGCVAWAVRSYYVVDRMDFVRRDGSGVMLVPKQGRLSIILTGNPGTDPGFTYIRGRVDVLRGTDYGRRILGFGGGRTPGKAVFVTAPFWFLAVVFAAPPVLVVRRAMRRRRMMPGKCRRCGYDLRATPEQCPECGEVQVQAHAPVS